MKKHNKYFCSGCDQVITRESTENAFYDYCSTASKKVLLRIVPKESINQKLKSEK